METLWPWPSAFLRLQPFNTVPNVVLTPNHKMFSLPLHNCNSATAMNYNVNICAGGGGFLGLRFSTCESRPPRVALGHGSPGREDISYEGTGVVSSLVSLWIGRGTPKCKQSDGEGKKRKVPGEDGWRALRTTKINGAE